MTTSAAAHAPKADLRIAMKPQRHQAAMQNPSAATQLATLAQTFLSNIKGQYVASYDAIDDELSPVFLEQA